MSMLAKLLRGAADQIHRGGYVAARVQYKPGPPFTILAALKAELNYLPSATIMQMGGAGDPDVVIYCQAINAINTFIGERKFAEWCADKGHGKAAASGLLRTLAQAIEDKDTTARWVSKDEQNRIKSYGQGKKETTGERGTVRQRKGPAR